MPTQSRSNRANAANAKYNVITDFPHLGLHAAAASGDVGLVKYALSHGQPVNSVLGGVLPLHAACAGGDDLIVKLLIQHGADVNAARLPLRYSDRNNRDAAGGPIVGTSGSTPLHFAAANGHANIIRTLLLNGARADLADKHGVTPQHVARENGWLECAELLKEWLEDKDRDLNSLGQLTPDYGLESGSGRGGGTDGSASRDKSPCRMDTKKRLHLKRSIDHALNTIKGTSTPPELFDKALLLSPSASASASLSAAPTPAGPIQSAPPSRSETFTGRRPSLQAERQTVSARYRRPKSAESGTDASPSPRKLGSKLSLLSLFKKSNIDGSSSSIASGPPTNVLNIEHSVPLPTSVTSPHSPALSASNSLPVSSPSKPAQMPLSSSPRDNPMVEHQRHRMGSSASAGVSGRDSTSPNTHGPVVRGAHPRSTSDSQGHSQGYKQSEDLLRSRSGSNPDESGGGGQARPSILRTHQRSSSSSGQQSQTHPSPSPYAQPQASSLRNIRFGASSSSSSLAGRARSPSAARQLSGTGTSMDPTPVPAQESRLRTISLSAQSHIPPSPSALGRKTSLPDGAEESELAEMQERKRGRGQVQQGQREDLEDEDDDGEMPQQTPPIIVDAAEDEDEVDDEDEDEEEYGFPIDHSQSFLPPMSPSHPPRDRATSAASSSSLSAPSHANTAHGKPTMLCGGRAGTGAFPFSINVPPPSETYDLGVPVNGEATLGPDSGLGSGTIGRLRGENTSSASTDNSHHQPPRSTSSASASASTGLATPNTPHYIELPSPRGAMAGKGLPPPSVSDSPRGEYVELLPASAAGLAVRRGASGPVDIDISKISTHAQAEALVQRTQASILSMGLEEEDDDLASSAVPAAAGDGRGHGRVGSGEDGLAARTPLSAKLLALGESLALERKLKEEEEKRAAFEALREQKKGREKPRRGSHGDAGMRTARTVRQGSARSESKEEAPYDALGIRRPPVRHTARAASHDEIFTSDSESDHPYSRGAHRRPQPQLHPRSFSHLHPDQHTSIPPAHAQLQSRSQSHHRTYSHSHGSIPANLRGIRALTPDPDLDSADLLGAPLLGLGVPLSRCSTAPSQATLASGSGGAAVAARRGDQQIRHMMSANKLTRMGFGADSLGGGLPGSAASMSGGALGGGVSASLGASLAGAGASSSSKGRAGGGGEGKRFRPIRSIMQSLQGRS